MQSIVEDEAGRRALDTVGGAAAGTGAVGAGTLLEFAVGRGAALTVDVDGVLRGADVEFEQEVTTTPLSVVTAGGGGAALADGVEELYTAADV